MLVFSIHWLCDGWVQGSAYLQSRAKGGHQVSKPDFEKISKVDPSNHSQHVCQDLFWWGIWNSVLIFGNDPFNHHWLYW